MKNIRTRTDFFTLRTFPLAKNFSDSPVTLAKIRLEIRKGMLGLRVFSLSGCLR